MFDYRITSTTAEKDFVEVCFSDAASAFHYVYCAKSRDLKVVRITEGGEDFTRQFLAMVEAARDEWAVSRR